MVAEAFDGHASEDSTEQTNNRPRATDCADSARGDCETFAREYGGVEEKKCKYWVSGLARTVSSRIHHST